MSITTIFDFTNPLNYTLNNIDTSGNVASLSLVSNPSQSFSQTFNSGAGFTYDSSKTSITGGVLSQINMAPSGLSAYFAWNSQLNGNYGTGSLTTTSFGGAAISGSVLNLNGGIAQYVTIPTVYGLNKVATYAFSLKPNYSNTPSTYQVFVAGASTNTNYFGLYQTPTTGHLIILVNASNGATLLNMDLGQWHPVAGTTYTFVLQIDVLNGATKLYIDGVQFGATDVSTGNRSTPDIVYVGRDFGASFDANFSISGLAIYSTIVGPSNVTPLADSQYLGDTITLPAFDYSGLGALIGFSAFSTGGDVNSPGYILNGLYWNGTMWVSSNGTYAQSNPKATVVANIATFPANNVLTITVITQSGNVPMSIAGPLRVTYAGQIYPVLGGSALSNVGLNIEDFLSFTASLSETGSDTVTFALKVNGSLMYWNGSAWVSSNGTAAQTNMAAVILANISTLLTVNSIVNLYALLVSGTGATTPSLTTMTVVYDFGAPLPSALATTIVFGFLSDITGSPVAGAQIVFNLVNILPNAYMEGADHILIAGSVTATTDANGYFQQAVIATTQFQGSNTFIQVIIKKGTTTQNVGPDGNPLYLTIPIQANIDITTLLSA